MNKIEKQKIINRIVELRKDCTEIVNNMNKISEYYNIKFNDCADFPRIYIILEECLPLVLSNGMDIGDYKYLSHESVQYMHNISILVELNALLK